MPAQEIQQSPNRDYFEIRGRGEMQLGILIEEMRREGYEMSLSPPSVVKQQGAWSASKTPGGFDVLSPAMSLIS